MLTCFQQRGFLESNKPDLQEKYILTLAQVRQLRDNWRNYTLAYDKYAAEHQQRQAHAQNASQAGLQLQANGTLTPHLKPAPQIQHLDHSSNPAQIVPPSLPPKRPNQFPASSPIAGPSTFTPPASATTPAASASTPIHVASSPQTPKSPSRPPPKKTAKRRTKATPKPAPATIPAPAETSTSTPPPSSTAAPIVLSVPSPAAPKPRTPAPAQAETPTPTGATKRHREDVLDSEALAGQSPPKKVKTEWEGAPSEELVKKQEAVEAIKTDDDATKFIEQMTEMLKMYTANGDGQDVLISAEISDELEKILKGFPGIAEDADSSLLGSAEAGELAPPMQLKDESEQFFDWASFMSEDESISKAATPDLVHQPSSTKTSPGSGSDNEGGHGASSSMMDAVRIAQPEMTNDPLELSIWGAIDGGEGLYYEAQDCWKWDEPPPSSELPWAIT